MMKFTWKKSTGYSSRIRIIADIANIADIKKRVITYSVNHALFIVFAQ
ncbi:hypothetical protein [Thalassotalea atypica]|nr:hypothetical protein [Thalassotalea atypica]